MTYNGNKSNILYITSMDSSVTTKITVSPPSAGGPNGNIRRRHETAADTKKNNKAEPSQEQEKLLVSPIVGAR